MKNEPTASEIIDRLGGTFAVAKLFNLTPPSVSEWKAKEKIPDARMMFLRVARPEVLGPTPPTRAAA